MKSIKKILILTGIVCFALILLPSLAMAETVSYIDENGAERTAEDVTMLTDAYLSSLSNSNVKQLQSGWYAISGEWSSDFGICFQDEGHLILCDDANAACKGITINNHSSLMIYGQGNGTGALSVTSTSSVIYLRNNTSLTINGGLITATGKGSYSAICPNSHSFVLDR